MSSAFAKREFARMEARAKIEEDLFTRVPLSKVERRRQKATTRSMNSLAEVGDFGDDVADLVDVVEELEGQRGKRQRLVDVVSQGANPKQKNKPVSGEQDVPLRDTLGVSLIKRNGGPHALTPTPPPPPCALVKMKLNPPSRHLEERQPTPPAPTPTTHRCMHYSKRR